MTKPKLYQQALIHCMIVMSLSLVARAQLQRPSGTTTIPAGAILSVGQGSQPDGSKFLLLVTAGGRTMKYVARRQDLNDQIKNAINKLDKDNRATYASNGTTQQEIERRQQELDTLVASQRSLQQDLSTSQETAALMLANVKRSANAAAPPGPGAVPAPPPAPGPPPAPAPLDISAIPSAAQVIEEIESSGPGTAQDVVTEVDPLQRGLLSLPVNSGDSVTFDGGQTNKADGSIIYVVVMVGGFEQHYVAFREDWAIYFRNEFKAELAIRDILKQESNALATESKLIGQNRTLLAANISDLQQALRLSKQNQDTLAMILKAQKRSKLEHFIEQIPSIAGIIAIAITKIVK